MEQNNDISLSLFTGFDTSEEEKKAHDKRMKEKWEFARQIERDARLIEAEIYRRMTTENGLDDFEDYELVICAETLKNLTAAVSQAEAFGCIPVYSIPAGWGGCKGE